MEQNYVTVTVCIVIILCKIPSSTLASNSIASVYLYPRKHGPSGP